MKATRIVGAILGVLMIAALFTGAVAAMSDNEVSLGDIYINKLYNNTYFVDEGMAKFNIENASSGWTNVKTGASIAFSKEPNYSYKNAAQKEYYIAENVASAKDSKVAGTYSKTIGDKTYLINVKYPSLSLSGLIIAESPLQPGELYPVGNLIGGTLATDQVGAITVSVNDCKDAGIAKIALTNPDKSLTKVVNLHYSDPMNAAPSTMRYVLDEDFVRSADLGVWTVKSVAINPNIDTKVGDINPSPIFHESPYSTLSPSYMYGEEYSFTIVSAETSKTLVAAAENVTQGNYVTLTLTAPYGIYLIKVNDEASIPSGQAGIEKTGGLRSELDADEILDASSDRAGAYALVYVDTVGSRNFVVKSLSTNDVKVTLYDTNGTTADIYNHIVKDVKKRATSVNASVKKEVTIKVKAGAITAKPEKESIYIGDEFKVTGTNDLGENVIFFIKGTNYNLEPVLKVDVKTVDKEAVVHDPEDYLVLGSGKVWDVTIDTAKFNNPDAGIYTIYIAKPNSDYYLKKSNAYAPYIWDLKSEDFDNTEYFDAYSTISVSLIQPFVTAKVDNEVVVQGDKLYVSGSAEGNPHNVKLYVFGTNFFKTTDVSVLDDGTYSYSQKVVSADKTEDTNAWQMAAGQYFLVVQHPMYDGNYNIGPVPVAYLTSILTSTTVDESKGYNIVLKENGSYLDGGTVLFNTNDRQSSNAAQALIDAIGSQNIDDMQAHLSFIVAGPTSYVNAVPSQVTKGQKLTISGTTTGHYNDIVAVELLSTAFAAVPKETVGSAAFATVTTRIGEDGVWSVSFDTTNMNADDYTVSIAVGQLDPVTAKTKIVAGSGSTPTVKPTGNPTVAPTGQPTTTPKTPGFGALAALAGLGAVAVLLLRRE